MKYLSKAAAELSLPLQKQWEHVYAKPGGPAPNKYTGWEDLHANLNNVFTHFALIDLKLPDSEAEFYKQLTGLFMRKPDTRSLVDIRTAFHTAYSYFDVDPTNRHVGEIFKVPAIIQTLQCYDSENETSFTLKAKALCFRLALAVVRVDQEEVAPEKAAIAAFKEMLYPVPIGRETPFTYYLRKTVDDLSKPIQ
jgi:hypothetical protein